MKSINNWTRKILKLYGIAITGALIAMPVYAESGLTDSTFYTGTAALLKDIMTWATVICPTVCAIAAVIFAIRRGMADEQDGKQWTRRIVIAVICGVLGGLISGLIAIISSYYA